MDKLRSVQAQRENERRHGPREATDTYWQADERTQLRQGIKETEKKRSTVQTNGESDVQRYGQRRKEKACNRKSRRTKL